MAETPSKTPSKTPSYVAITFGFVFLVLAMGLDGGMAILFYLIGIGCFVAGIGLNLRAGGQQKGPE